MTFVGVHVIIIYVPDMRADMFIYRDQCIHNLWKTSTKVSIAL